MSDKGLTLSCIVIKFQSGQLAIKQQKSVSQIFLPATLNFRHQQNRAFKVLGEK